MTGLEAKDEYKYIVFFNEERSVIKAGFSLLRTVFVGIPKVSETDAKLYEIKIFCEHCGKYIDEDARWICGYCDVEICSELPIYPFLAECSKCGKEPPALQCPHCNANVLLIDDPDPRHVARFIPGKTITPPENPVEKQKQIRNQIEEAKLQTEFARAKAELEAASKPHVSLNRREKALNDMLEEMQTLKSKNDLINKMRKEWESEAKQLPEDERDAALEKIEDIFSDARMKYL